MYNVTNKYLTHISEVVKKTDSLSQDYRSGVISPYKVSSAKFMEKVGGYYPGDQIVLAGRSGTGKTAYALRDLIDIIELNPEKKTIILYFSWEMLDWRNVLRIQSRKLAVPIKYLLEQDKWKDIKEAADRVDVFNKQLSTYPIYFCTESLSVDKWASVVKQVSDNNPEATIINMVDHTRLVKALDKSEKFTIDSFMNRGMSLKQSYPVINYFLSQMNRNSETSLSRDDLGKYPPIASDIYGSDAVMQTADVVMALHRPGMYGQKEYRKQETGYGVGPDPSKDYLLVNCIIKQRDGWTGELFMEHDLSINHINDLKTF